MDAVCMPLTVKWENIGGQQWISKRILGGGAPKCDHNEGNCQIYKVAKLYQNLPTIGIIIIGKIYNGILRIVFVILFDIVQRKIPLSPFICCEKN